MFIVRIVGGEYLLVIILLWGGTMVHSTYYVGLWKVKLLDSFGYWIVYYLYCGGVLLGVLSTLLPSI